MEIEKKDSNGIFFSRIYSYIGVIFFIGLSIFIGYVRPFMGLGTIGHIILASLITAISFWLFRPADGSYMIGVIIIIIGGVFSGLSVYDLTIGFSSPSLWLLIPAMFLGYSLLKTGLGKRFVFLLFSNIGVSYKKILFCWFVVGIIFSLLTPSIIVRFLIITPVAVNIADMCGLEKNSIGRSLIVISGWTISIFPGIAWLNGSLYGPVFSSFLPESMSSMANAEAWFMVMGPPWLLYSTFFFFILYRTLRPEEELVISKEKIGNLYKQLDPFHREEICCLIVFVLMIIGLIGQNIFTYNTSQVIQIAFFLLLFCNVLTIKDISQGVNWDTIVFFGMILGLPNIMEVSGLSDWIEPKLTSLLLPIAENIYTYVICSYFILLLIRFIDVAQGWITVSILCLAAPTLYNDFGIHPLISLTIYIAACNVFFLHYHQPWIGQAEAVFADNGWAIKHLQKAAVLYAVSVPLMLMGCIIYWKIIKVL